LVRTNKAGKIVKAPKRQTAIENTMRNPKKLIGSNPDNIRTIKPIITEMAL